MKKLTFVLFAALLFVGADYGNNAEARAPRCTIGTVIFFAGAYAPKNWLTANGKLLPISKYTALYSVLRNNFGGRVGKKKFALPKIKGLGKVRAIICVKGNYPARE